MARVIDLPGDTFSISFTGHDGQTYGGVAPQGTVSNWTQFVPPTPDSLNHGWLGLIDAAHDADTLSVWFSGTALSPSGVPLSNLTADFSGTGTHHVSASEPGMSLVVLAGLAGAAALRRHRRRSI